MITLEVYNRIVKIIGANRRTIRALDKATSYLIEGSHFAPAYRQGYWDGREKLLKQSASGIWTYSGLFLDVVNTLKSCGADFKAVDKTTKGARRRLVWSADVVLRPYQERVVGDLLSRPFRGIGTAVMPIRSGKSKTMARCLHEIGRTALVIVPSKLLLHQMAGSLSDCFPQETIGIIGDSMFQIEFITVATVQSLNFLRNEGGDKWKRVCQEFDVLVLDECHHARGGGDWHKVFVDINARYRLGFSATLFGDSNTEQGRGIIWAKAACGPVRARVTTKELVELGYLMRQHVVMYNVKEPTTYQLAGWSQTMVTRCVHENSVRNGMIAKLCQGFQADGRRVIVCCNRKNHIAAIADALDETAVDYRIMTGDDSQP